MRARLSISLAALLLAATLAVFARPDTVTVQTTAVRAAIAANVDDWAREDLYRMVLLNSQRSPSISSPQVGEVVHANPNRVRVLVLGDSFTVGTGLVDLSARWPALLEAELNRRSAPGAFEVVALANGGASTYTELAWALAIADGTFAGVPGSQAQQEYLREPFDAVVIGYVENDHIPGFFDETIPAPLEATATQAGFSPPTRFIEVTPDEQNNILHNGASDPNEPLFDPALRALRSVFADLPMLVVPLPYLAESQPLVAADMDRFAAAGFVVAETPTVASRTAAYAVTDLMVTGVDAHPGTALQHAYAVDAATALLATLPSQRVATATTFASAPTALPVVYAAPLEAAVQETAPGQVRLVVPPAMSLERPCVSYPATDSYLECVDGRTQFRIRLHQDAVAGSPGTPVPAQYAPCVALGKPHVAVSFSPYLTDTDRLTVLLEDAPGPVEVVVFGYDADGFEVHEPAQSLGLGERLSVVPSPLHRGMLISAADEPIRCDATSSSVIVAPAVQLLVTQNGSDDTQ